MQAKSKEGHSMTDLKKAALIYGSTEQHIRVAAQQQLKLPRDILPFVYCLKQDGKRAGSYKINFYKLREFIGDDEWERGLLRVEEYLKDQEVG